MRKRLVLAALAAVFLVSSLHAQQSQGEHELQAYVSRQSAIWFEQEVEDRGTVDAGSWKAPIESAFIKISSASAEPGFLINYEILNDRSFNASCFPGGQFIINSGALEFLDNTIEKKIGLDLDHIEANKLQELREEAIAPVLAHELSHYYCRHAYQRMKMELDSSGKLPPDFDIRLLKFTQDNELEADRTGYLLLKKAGYDPDSMIELLEAFNNLQQARIPEMSPSLFNIYLSDHPSPHARVAALQGNKQGLHKWAADLERAFSDVQLGTNLPQALKTIEDGLELSPSNLFFLRERALALHKQWLLTVSLEKQKLRAIIDSPAFQDAMITQPSANRGPEEVPGDQRMYAQARAAYEDAIGKSDDQSLASDFALLLAYSTQKADRARAAQLALAAATAVGSLENTCNYATVLFLVGEQKRATSMVTRIAALFDQAYVSMIHEAEEDSDIAASLRAFLKQIQLTQELNREYTSANFTPTLNLALCLAQTGEADQARDIAKVYLKRYESSSEWARYLSAKVGVAIPVPSTKASRSVNGIQIGSSISAVVEHWGKPDEILVSKDGSESWVYDSLRTELEIQSGMVHRISLNSGQSPKVENRFGVGSLRQDIEGVIGQPQRMAGRLTIYEGQSLAVLYMTDVAQQIVLFH